MKIVTMTLNPAFDIHCSLSDFSLGGEHFAKDRACDVGGKGINIARACHQNGVDCMAYVLVGTENGAEFEAGLRREGIAYRALYADGRIRENLTLHPENAPETRISFDGFSADARSLFAFEELLGEALDGTYFCLTGSLAKGISTEDAKAFLLRLRAKGAKILLDSRSFAREDILDIKPFLIKPNLGELKKYTDCPCETEEDMIASAKRLQGAGIENILLSMGEAGALLVRDGTCLRALAPRVEARSTVGAGDSMIAGYLAGLLRGESAEESLRLAVAFGSAACLSEGTQPPKPEDVSELKEKTTVFALENA